MYCVSRTWDVRAVLPKMAASGTYKMFGTIPPNVDLGYSEGAQRYMLHCNRVNHMYFEYLYRFRAEKVSVNSTLVLDRDGDGVKVTDILINVDLEDIYLEMECLFPR